MGRDGGRRTARTAVAAVVLAVALVACGTTNDRKAQSLCSVYADFVAAEQKLNDVDPTKATAGQMSDALDEGILVVNHLKEVDDGRYTQYVENLDEALSDVKRTLDSVDEDEDYSTWQPLVKDSVEDARKAAAKVHELIEPSCTPAS